MHKMLMGSLNSVIVEHNKNSAEWLLCPYLEAGSSYFD